ncbi:MAG TPA: hypothetical protein VNO69_00295 [Methyloceanibacter sp.]|nr:hypothetical protein [Methyloceanibacter sp.]
MAKSAAEIAIELRGKFEFYLLALNFSILGLSIQTSKFGTYLSAGVFELAGWFALFLSGVIGLLRGEWIPVAYDIQSKITTTARRRREIQEALQRGIQIEVPFMEGGKQTVLRGEPAAVKLDGLMNTLEQQHKATEDKVIRRYSAMRTTFMIGIGCLLVARGIPPALSITERAKPLLKSLAATW